MQALQAFVSLAALPVLRPRLSVRRMPRGIRLPRRIARGLGLPHALRQMLARDALR